MTKKRKQTDSNPEEPLYNKRSRLTQADGDEDGSSSVAQPRLDPTYGQRGAFPGLEDAKGDDELFYGPANDGLEYLRMVRCEAKTVPNLLVAPVSPCHSPKEDGGLYEDYPQGYYADGAYTAAPLASDHATGHQQGDGIDEDIDPQEAYYAALCAHFAELSSILQSPPPLPDGASGTPSHYRPKQWRHKILKTTPKMAALAQIPQEAVVLGLETLEDVLTASNLRVAAYGRNIGAWVWGLLARCRDVGMMGSEEVGVVRKLGKKAVWLLRRIAAGEVAEDEVVEVGDAEDEIRKGNPDAEKDEDDDETGLNNTNAEDDDGDDGTDISSQHRSGPITSRNGTTPPLISPSKPSDTEADALAEARQRILSFLSPAADPPTQTETPESPSSLKPPIQIDTSNAQHTPQKEGITTHSKQQAYTAPELTDAENIHATLDMIVTIAGSFYGQRDLLDGRLLWDEIV